ncbi:MAG: YvcK family protein [Acidobacteria bacterium]|nr:YvcK family protein [Acidobacteriota bacterium]
MPTIGGDCIRNVGDPHQPIRWIDAGAIRDNALVLLRRLNVGCFGGGTGLPSLIGGLKHNPWLRVNAVVTMFDSGGSSGVLRDQLGVLPPGDVLKCALALARNESEARRILLTRLSGFEHDKLGGHTGGNLLLSMMEQYSGDFLAAVDGLRTLLDCVGRVWPISVDQATVCAEYEDGSTTHGEVEVDVEQSQGRRVSRIWLEPEVTIHPAAAAAIPTFDAIIIGPGSFYTSLIPIFLPDGVREAVATVDGPIVLVTNLLTEGRGMKGFTAGAAVSRISEAIGRPVDVVVVNTGHPGEESLDRYADEHKEPLLLGDVPDGCEVITGEFWQGAFARHARRRLAYAVWGVLTQRLLR